MTSNEEWMRSALFESNDPNFPVRIWARDHYDPEFAPVQVEHLDTKIDEALKILTPEAELREECRKDIAAALYWIERSKEFKPLSADDRRELGKLRSTLEKAKTTKSKLPRSAGRSFDMACDLQAGIKECDEIEMWDREMRSVGDEPYRLQMHAVAGAHYLVKKWLVELRHAYAAESCTRDNPWDKLSAILFGKKDNDMLDHMRRYQQLLGRQRRATELQTS